MRFGSRSVEEDWRREARWMEESPNLIRGRLDNKVEANPKPYKKCLRLLDKFFDKNPPPVDIAFILYSGLMVSGDTLGYHLEGNDLLYLRPETSHRWNIQESYLEGEVHPERRLLMVDSDMVTGASMRESADRFTNLGYKRSNIYGYLALGCK